MGSKSRRGQTLILVVLTMIVALTVGLSVASRTITNLRISRQNEESQRAFQAAEAGIEQILQSGGESSSAPLANNSNFTTAVSYPSGTSFLLNGGEMVDQDTGIDVWLATYPNFDNPLTSNITFYWSTDNQTVCTNPSGTAGAQVKSGLEVVILSGNMLAPTLRKYFFEATGCSERIVNAQASSVPPGNPPGSSVHFNSMATINPIISDGLIMRVIPIFNSTKINIVSSVALPQQGTIVQSVGKSGETARKVQFYQSHPQIPVEVFPYSLISQ